LLRDQEKVKQLMARFNSLMQEGRYRLAEDAAATEAQKIMPENPCPLRRPRTRALWAISLTP